MKSDGFEFKLAQWQIRNDIKLRRKLYRKLASLTGNGVKLIDAINDLYERNHKASPRHPLTIALADWSLKIRSSQPFNEAVEGWVPGEERMLFVAGAEDSNKALVSCVRIMGPRIEMRKAIVKGLSYPIILITIAILMAAGFAYFLIPVFIDTAPKGFEFSGLPGAVKAVTEFIRNWSLLILSGGIVSISLIVYSLANWTGSLRAKFDNVSPWSIYRMQQGVAWLIALSALISTGQKTIDAIQMLSKDASPWMKERCKAILFHMNKANSFGDSLMSIPFNFPDQEIRDDIVVYSEASGFDEALEIVADEWSKDALESVESKLSILKIAATFFIAIMLGFFAAGMLTMEMQIMDAVKRG